MSVNMTYGAYDFASQAGPIPFLTISRTFNRADDGTRLSTLYNTTIDGTLTPLPSGTVGYINIDAMQDALMAGFSTDGQLFQVTCDATTLISEYPRINSIRLDKSQDNWYQTTPYTIEMEWDGAAISGDIYIESAQETWNIEVSDESSLYSWTLPGSTGDSNNVLVRVSHNINAKGIAHYSGGSLIRPAWEHARLFCVSKMGYDSGMVTQTGVLNLPSLTGYNHMRVVNVDELGGSYGITESWLAAPTGTKAIEDFTASVRYNSESDLTTVDVAGSIQGIEVKQFNPTYSVTTYKYDNASGYWNVVKPKLFGRAQLAAGEFTSYLNPMPRDIVVGKNPTRGVLNYSYSYDSSPCNFIAGSKWEQISISDSLPTDLFTSIQIPGRAAGVLHQDLNTYSDFTRTVDINVLMEKPTGCNSLTGALALKPTGQVNTLLCELYTQLANQANQIFVSNNNENYDVKTGRYQRNVTFTVGFCSGQNLGTYTSFC